MAPDGTSKRQLNPNATQREEHPLWSHDGHWLMVARPQASTASLWLTQADGSAERQVAANVTLPASFYGLIDWPAAYAWWQPANGASGA
jgi:Tol biopolymer transport system component